MSIQSRLDYFPFDNMGLNLLPPETRDAQIGIYGKLQVTLIAWGVMVCATISVDLLELFVVKGREFVQSLYEISSGF